MGKRGIFELQARSAFAILTGAMLLLFFVFVVNKQMEANSYETSVKIGNFLEKSFVGEEASYKVRLPKEQRIWVDCESKKLFIGESSITWPQSVEVFAEPSSTEKLMISNVDVKIPFLIGRASIITSEDFGIALAFDNSSIELASRIMEVFGDKVLHAGKLEEGMSLIAVVAYKGKAVRALGLKEGKIVFFESNGPWKEVSEAPYINPEFFIAAIVSDFENYKCGVNRMLKRAGSVAESYEEKAIRLENEDCTYPISYLQTFKDGASYSNIGDLLQAANSIRESNSALIENSCEVLY